MQRTNVVEGARVRADDHAVLKALVRAAIPADGTTATPIRVGVENEAGAIYRRVQLFGLTEKARFIQQMESLGFAPDPTLGGGGREYDLVFAKEG